jgi:hypothetical protein
LSSPCPQRLPSSASPTPAVATRATTGASSLSTDTPRRSKEHRAHNANTTGRSASDVLHKRKHQTRRVSGLCNTLNRVREDRCVGKMRIQRIKGNRPADAGSSDLKPSGKSGGEPPGLTIRPEDWLIQEYNLLSQHYFHEDNYFQQSVAIFSTLNSGLIAFYTSTLISKSGFTRFSVPAIGILLSAVWMISLVRTRERRAYAENRIIEMEVALGRMLTENNTLVKFLDIGTRAGWHLVAQQGMWKRFHIGWIRDVPASKLSLALPPAFIAIWVLLIIVL